MRAPDWIVPAGLALLAVAGTYVTGMPGNGAFVAVVWLAGFAGALAVRGIAGWLWMQVAILAVLLALNVALTGSPTSGLVLFVAAVLAAVASHGWLVGALARRAVTEGWPAAGRDTVLVLGGLAAVVVMIVGWMFARELGASPP